MTSPTPDLAKLRIDRTIAPIRRRRRRRFLVLVILVVLAAGGAAAYWLKPHPAVVSTTP